MQVVVQPLAFSDLTVAVDWALDKVTHTHTHTKKKEKKKKKHHLKQVTASILKNRSNYTKG